MHQEPDGFQKLIGLVEHLRSPEGCPWDREQTHTSLKRNLLEETHEVLEAIDGADPAKLAEELGDILVQVAFHAQLAREAGEFSVEDVLDKINDKLVHRHPHVFAGDVASDAREVERNWEAIKEKEGARKSPVEGIPRELPSLAHAQLMQDRVGKVGFEWEDVSGVLDKLAEEVEELREASSEQERAMEMGDVLFTMVNLCRWMDIQAEDALRQANARFRGRYATMERLASEQSLDFPRLPLEDKEKLWQEAKGQQRS